MRGEYVEQRNGGYYLTGTPVSLDSVVCAFNRGDSPERILESYPLLENLARVYGAIAFYLDHREALDPYLKENKLKFEAEAVPLSETNPALGDRLQRARARMAGPESAERRP